MVVLKVEITVKVQNLIESLCILYLLYHWSLGNHSSCADLLFIITKPSTTKWAYTDIAFWLTLSLGNKGGGGVCNKPQTLFEHGEIYTCCLITTGSFTFTYPLTVRVVGAQQMTSQPVSSIFLLSTALWNFENARPVYSLMLSFHFFFCLPCLLPPSTVPFKIVSARPDEQKTCPYHFSLHLFMMVWRSLYGPVACWILALTSSLVTWSLYEMHSLLQ